MALKPGRSPLNKKQRPYNNYLRYSGLAFLSERTKPDFVPEAFVTCVGIEGVRASGADEAGP